MDVSALQSARVDPSKLPLDRLAASSQVPQSEKIGEVSRQFEAILLHQILAQSQQPVFQSKYISNSATDGIYRDLVVNQLAENISKSGSFGLANSLKHELQRQSGAPDGKSASPASKPGPIGNSATAHPPGAATSHPPALAANGRRQPVLKPLKGAHPTATVPHPVHLDSPHFMAEHHVAMLRSRPLPQPALRPNSRVAKISK